MLEELGLFLAYEATRGLPLREESVRTPLGEAVAGRIEVRPVVAPILRAGLGLLPGFLDVIDDAVVAHLGFYRDPKTLQAIPYYANVPDDLNERHVFVLDPMLATGHSGRAALDALETRGAKQTTFVCVIAAPEGIEVIRKAHPEVRIVTASIDERLNDHGYIVPGLGDAGDRMFGSTSSVPVSVGIAARP
ncbi:MAG: uracil phosphoribosyltransferase [Vulcanimicrobiaceae bacterium]